MSRKHLEIHRQMVKVPGRDVALSVVDIKADDPQAPTAVFLHGGGGISPSGTTR